MAPPTSNVLFRSSTPPPTEFPSALKARPQLTPERVKTLIRPLPDSPSKILYPGQRPEWWDGAHRLLRDVAIRNQENPIRKGELQPIEQLADEVIARQNPVELLMLLKLLSEFIVYDTKRIFFKVLAPLRTLNPGINDYFFDVDSDDPSEGPSLSPMAMNLMFRFYEEEFGYPPGILSCQKLSALPDLLTRLIESGPNQMRGWVVLNDCQDSDPHVVPVFAINHEGKTYIFVFDSLGHTISKDPGNTRISASLGWLLKHFENRSDMSGKLAIYSYRIKRQNSEVGCATFSLHDLKNLCERHFRSAGNIVDFYASQAPDHQPRLMNEELHIGSSFPVWEIDTLPPEMMKVTQSFSEIKHYTNQPPVLSPPIPRFPRYSSDGRTYDTLQDLEAFNQSVAQIERTTPDGNAVNLYIEQKRFADIVYLISRYFNRSDDSTGSARGSLARNLVFPDG